MIITLKQSDKPHDTNRVHDAFIRAGVVPERVESSNGTSTFIMPAGTPQSFVDSVLNGYVYKAPAPPPDFKALMADIEAVDLSDTLTAVQFRANIKLRLSRIEKALKVRWNLNGNGG